MVLVTDKRLDGANSVVLRGGNPLGDSLAGPLDLQLGRRVADALWWATRVALALFLFVGALQLMKTGAASLDILRPGGFLVKNAASTLGLGWLGALLVLSGSPIAASALTLVAASEDAAAGAARFTELQGFTMLTGSRLGAAFVVLVTAVVYAFRARDGERRPPVSTAVIALSATAVVYIPSALIGATLLRTQPFASLDLRFPTQFVDVIDVLYGGAIAEAKGHPALLVFAVGLGALLISFRLIDSALPALDGTTLSSRRREWLTRKWPMFCIGSAVALVTMSVSVAITVLVPLVARKRVKAEHILPYVMGANIATLGDTMLAAFALHSAAAVRIVLAEILATSLLSILALTFFYPQLQRALWRFQVVVTHSRPRLALFTVCLFLLPALMILVAGAAG